MLVERHCNKWDSALRNKNKKTHHNSCRAQRKPEGEAREEEGGKNESQVGIYPVFHVFNPGPFLHTPGTKSVSGVEVGGTRVIAEEGSTIWDALPTLHSQFIR